MPIVDRCVLLQVRWQPILDRELAAPRTELAIGVRRRQLGDEGWQPTIMVFPHRNQHDNLQKGRQLGSIRVFDYASKVYPDIEWNDRALLESISHWTRG